MAVELNTLALVDLIIQFVMLMLLFLAVSKAKKGDLNNHCTILRITVPVQLAAIFIFMLPQFPGYKIGNAGMIDFAKIIHHISGSLLIGLWIYVNLVYSGYIKWTENFRSVMKSAFVLWILAFLIGAYIYIIVYS